jgi:hypothetical protein
MSSTRALSVAVSVGFLLVVSSAFPPPVRAAWVNSAGTQFQVGGQLTQIIPTAAGTSFVDPSCGSQGGTSLALVQGRKLAGVDAVLHPLVLVVSCLDNDDATKAARLNFISPTDGKVIKQIQTTSPLPGNGWAHLVLRPDKGDLLGCRSNGALYSIDFSQDNNTTDGMATALPQPPLPAGANSCRGLAWDAEADMIYLGLSTTVGVVTANSVVRFKEGNPALQPDFTSPCAANGATNGLAISGGVLLVSCEGALTIDRLDKNTGLRLGAHGTLTAGLLQPSSDPVLGGFACDPVTFHKDATGKDLFTDALWSRRGANGVVALEFPAFTCGLPSSSITFQSAVPFSPLAAGFSAPSGLSWGEVPRAACFDLAGNVKDSDGDGLPDCWETSGSGIDFDGDGTIDLQLCVQVNTNGDGVTLTTECADPNHKDLFVEIDYMQFHKPNPQALSQTQSFATPKSGGGFVGVQSVREAFAAAPLCNPTDTPNCVPTGIRAHFQVDEQVMFTPLSGPPTSHVDQVAFPPCTLPASSVATPAQAVEFDTVKAANFGTATERLDAKTLNAKRLAFRYVLFAHKLVPATPTGGANGSGCAELGGDDAVVTLGSFAGTVAGHTGGFGTKDQQAGTFMHELGHLLGLEHGGHDKVNCKPNYRSVMSYNRQFAGSPIPNRRLDYSRSLDPLILRPDGTIDDAKTGILDEGGLLNEDAALGADPSLGPIPPAFASADQIVFGPNAWSLVSANAADINWNRISPSNQTNASGDINRGATTGCDGSGGLTPTPLEGHDDWSNLLYRFSAAVDFVGGQTPEEMTSDNEKASYEATDADGKGVGDGVDCGTFLCTHRIDIKPSFPLPKIIDQTGNVKIVIFSERDGTSTQEWNAPAQVSLNHLDTLPLMLRVDSFEVSVKVNNQGGGTCSVKDEKDPITGLKDGIKDLECQFEFPVDGPPTGTHFGIVSGFFFVNPSCRDPLNPVCEFRGFTARQELTVVR